MNSYQVEMRQILRNTAQAARIFFAAALAALACALACVAPAYADTLEELEEGYRLAYAEYESLLGQQAEVESDISDNGDKIKQTEVEISQAESEIDRNAQALSETAVALYKYYPESGSIVDAVLGSSSIGEALNCLEGYARIQGSYTDQLRSFKELKAQLDTKKQELSDLRKNLKEQKKQLKAQVHEAKVSAAEWLAAYRDLDHSDGELYHQRQGNNKNCGATAFIMGVNILLHENRFTDNVGVWASSAFKKDSTGAIARKGTAWLRANGLDDQMVIENVSGDIHSAEKMRAELEQGNVIITSSGSGSIWQYTDGPAKKGAHSRGHYIVFYY